MFPRLLNYWHDLRSSLWALPLLMVAVAAVAAVLAVHVPVRSGDDPVWFLYSGDAEDAPQFLSNLVTAMITMATLAVSITMVVLTLAAQQLGPRLIRSFMADRRTQITLGLFVATVVYLLLVLRTSYGATDRVPNLAVTGGTVLVLVCLVALLVFVHHLARSIIADTTIDRVGAALDHDIERLLPEAEEVEDVSAAPPPREGAAQFLLHTSGYVQSIDHDGIVECAREMGAVVELEVKPGRHVIAGGVAGWITPPHVATEALRESIATCVVTGGERSSVQDLETSIRHLVEVALRALSPSVSDPFTAIAVVDRLTESLAKIMQRGSARCVWRDQDGTVRLLMPATTFADMADEAFRQIRQHSHDQPAVLIRLVESLGKLLEQADAEQSAVLEEKLTIVVETGRRSIQQEQDLAALEAAAAAALKSDRRTPVRGGKP
jgi:uncharacterized membrane protein